MGVFPELKLIHLIPKERISENYLLKLFEGTTTSDQLLAYKWQGVTPSNPRSLFGMLSVLRHILVLRGMRRRMYLATVRAALQTRRIIELTTDELLILQWSASASVTDHADADVRRSTGLACKIYY